MVPQSTTLFSDAITERENFISVKDISEISKENLLISNFFSLPSQIFPQRPVSLETERGTLFYSGTLTVTSPLPSGRTLVPKNPSSVDPKGRSTLRDPLGFGRE